MAQTPELSKTDSILRSVCLEVEDLPRVLSDWSGWNDDIQLDFTLEWMGLMDHLFYVRDQVAAGAATPEQTAAYQQLQADLRAAAPILRILELRVPPELLQEPTAAGGQRRSA